jgi:hypothetical protein
MVGPDREVPRATRAFRQSVRVAVAVGLVSLVAAAVGEAGEAQQSRVTIFARPTVVGWAEGAQLFGTARGAGPDDTVAIEVRECGSSAFRAYAEAHVMAGGGWTMPVGTAVTSTFRARWRSFTSPRVTIRQAANVLLARKRAGSGFVVSVISKRSMWRKKVEVQRRQAGSWRTVKTVRLTDSVSSTGTVSASEATFRLAVPRRTQLRAVLPSDQARPCYVESVSRVVRA